ncbi:MULTISPECIES: TetR/AcrR family transcriptional regulator [unclassified Clostridium]|uniref:TetR/AcrR family transcriptional regulator n=1 Tax=unclassified Clostridium TaxID=2614128 RepID=UPI00029815E8|nr:MULTISPECIES: TetR/AcrR family transcriptional regulator [unclassified Clostridium]EKQ55471.1 MAG: transcriptional regulator [Clostridium sp. Maddingley MBC34-26]
MFTIGITERKERERLARKIEIINAAEKIFFEKGFENSTMDDIAKEAEFTKKTIYSYFKSKDELYFEIMLSGFNVLNELFDKVIKEDIKSNEFEKISKFGKVFVEFSKNYPGYFTAIADYENKDFDFKDEDDNFLIKKCYTAGQYSIELLKSCIINGIKKGELIDNADSNTICLLLWSTMMGYIGLLNKKEKYINAYYDKNVEDLIEDGINILLKSIKK